jgi:tRNA G37 N-methylase TrmD
MAAPDILMSGDHAAVARWRHEQAKVLTAKKLAAAPTNPQPTSNPRPTGRGQSQDP